MKNEPNWWKETQTKTFQLLADQMPQSLQTTKLECLFNHFCSFLIDLHRKTHRYIRIIGTIVEYSTVFSEMTLWLYFIEAD